MKNFINGLLGKHRDRMAQSAREQFREEVKEEVVIRDMIVNGQVVIALCVNGIAIDSIGQKPTAQDPDGFWIEREPSELIQRMKAIRDTEFVNRCVKNHVSVSLNEGEGM